MEQLSEILNANENRREMIQISDKCTLWEKAQEYVVAIVNGVDDERRVHLHEELAALYGLKPSETRIITDNLPIPIDPYAERESVTINKCASLITNAFAEIRNAKEEGREVNRKCFEINKEGEK